MKSIEKLPVSHRAGAARSRSSWSFFSSALMVNTMFLPLWYQNPSRYSGVQAQKVRKPSCEQDLVLTTLVQNAMEPRHLGSDPLLQDVPWMVGHDSIECVYRLHWSGIWKSVTLDAEMLQGGGSLADNDTNRISPTIASLIDAQEIQTAASWHIFEASEKQLRRLPGFMRSSSCSNHQIRSLYTTYQFSIPAGKLRVAEWKN